MTEQSRRSIAPESDGAGRSLLRGILEYIGELIRVVVISLAIILPVRYFLVQPFYVKGASMEPNFYDHEYLVIDELSYRLRKPQRGEIVVFRYPDDPAQFFIKRIVGLPGEAVRIENNQIYITAPGQAEEIKLAESYIAPEAAIEGRYKVTLAQDEYYLLGDNRSSSLDSRRFGPVAKQFLIGRAWLRGWPLDRITRFAAPVYGIAQPTS